MKGLPGKCEVCGWREIGVDETRPYLSYSETTRPEAELPSHTGVKAESCRVTVLVCTSFFPVSFCYDCSALGLCGWVEQSLGCAHKQLILG